MRPFFRQTDRFSPAIPNFSFLDFITLALNVVKASPLAGSADYDSEELIFPDERELYEPTDTEINNYFNEAFTRNLHLD